MTDSTTPASPVANPEGRPVTEVAVGVLVQPDGRYLLAQRPVGKPYEGYWEFPGGKLEPGESVEAALARELHDDITQRLAGLAISAATLPKAGGLSTEIDASRAIRSGLEAQALTTSQAETWLGLFGSVPRPVN